MSKERVALENIKFILEEAIQAWKEYENNPDDDDLIDAYDSAMPTLEEMQIIYRIIDSTIIE